MLMSMVRPFISDNVANNVVFHTSDLSTLRNYFSGDILPSDLGGTGAMGPMDNTHNVEQLRGMAAYFQDILKYGYGDTAEEKQPNWNILLGSLTEYLMSTICFVSGSKYFSNCLFIFPIYEYAQESHQQTNKLSL